MDDGSGWSWRVSVSLDADLAWWASKGIKRIWVRTLVKMSLGQAFEWVEQQRGGSALVPDDEGEWVPCSPRAEAGISLSGYRRLIEVLEGRCLLREEMEPFLSYHGLPEDEETWLYFVQQGVLEGTIRIRHGVEREKRRRGLFGVQGKIAYRCVRCGSGEERLHRTPCPHCGTNCPYCEACLTMGRVRFCGLLVQGLRRGRDTLNVAGASHEEVAKQWSLSPAQSDAAWQALRFLKEGGRSGHSFLLWAVTGAGKTEMMFPLADHVLRGGGRVLIATPRKDVVLELQPRIQAAFPMKRVVTLYGGSRERWESGDIILATTHQLYRFREAFDLAVVDEIDAFPFHGDKQLLHAAREACARNGKFILLSATPPKQLRLLAERGRLPHAKVCVRFHRHPLPVPRRICIPPLRRFSAAAAGLPMPLKHAMRNSIDRDAQLFVFVPHIESIPGLVRMISSAFPHVSVEGTSSKDSDRSVKVEHFRGKDIRIIVTTTILERGVTVPKTDVFIIDADSPLFDDASLIQMAGRAGRKLEDPQGHVYFCAADWTKGQRDAVRQIRDMNALARKKGYLVS
ncbi:DEAD/DEAH box helicase [Paenibacillus thermotolerans]|uniref:DEAD/DEAH box helicase n=1 Tax=Paenibacillus thermotolerans TaxID=3027807 RepID=UPI0023677A51|nr:MULTISPECIES: DEAD/DEAH box helicase [unclassified Paenibacillus]